MSPTKLHLNEDQTFVPDRSREKAAELIERAEKAGLSASVVSTTYNGYIVPTAILASDVLDNGEADVDKADGTGGEQADGEQQTPETPGEATVPDPASDATDSDPAAGEDQSEENVAKQFDVTEATIDEVKDYLAGADDTERERVLAAESAREKPRKGVLDLAAPSEGAK